MYKPILTFRDQDAAIQAAKEIYTDGASAHVHSHKHGDQGSLYVVEAEEPEVVDSLRKVAEKGLSEDAEKCPKCGSSHTEYPAGPQSSPSLHAMSTIADKLFGSSPNILCKQCTNTWN